MKHVLMTALLLVGFSANATTVECKIWGINNVEKLFTVNLSQTRSLVSTFNGMNISMSEKYGYFEIAISGEDLYETSAGTRTSSLDLTIESTTISCEKK